MKTMRLCCRYEINLQYGVRRRWEEDRNDEAVSFRNDTKTRTFLKMFNYENAEQRQKNDKEAET